jgi:hypothetical protein
MTALLLLTTLAATDPTYVPPPQAQALDARAGNDCDRYIPREKAKIPSFGPPKYALRDEGTLEFRYRFYARQGELRVSAMSVEGERHPGVVETKYVWEDGDEVFVHMTGPVAELDKLPLCVRKARPGFDLDGLYSALKPRLKP